MNEKPKWERLNDQKCPMCNSSLRFDHNTQLWYCTAYADYPCKFTIGDEKFEHLKALNNKS